jgi:hypothetical protein
MLTRRIVDHTLPADSIAEFSVHSPARQSTLPVLLAVSLVCACLVVEAAVLRVGIDDLDEGYFVQQAVRVLHGQVPYRDFATFYSPGLAYVHAVLFSALGLLGPRALALAARGGLALLLFIMTRPLVRQPLWAAAPGVFLLVGLDDAPVRWEPHPGWLSTFFAVLAAWCLSHGPSTRWLVLSGVAAGVAYAFKQNTGVLILAAIIAWGGFGLALGRDRLYRALVPTAAFAAVTLLWLVPLLIAMGGRVGELGVLVGAVDETGLFSPPEPALLIPVACLGGGLWLVHRSPDPRLRWYALAGAALLLTEFPRMDTLHLAWSAPLLLVLGAAAVSRQRAVFAAVAVIAALALLAPTVTSRLAYVGLPRAPIDAVEAPSQTAADLQGVVNDVQQRTAAGEPIFVYPTSPLVYVLAERRNPTRFDHLNPGAASPAQIQATMADLTTAHVRLVVVSDYWRAVWGAPGANAELESWLASTFPEEVARHGAYRVLMSGL